MRTRLLAYGLLFGPALILASCGGGTAPAKSSSAHESTTVPRAPPTIGSTTVPPTPSIPEAFSAESVTFVSTQMGWVLGKYSCAPTATLCAPVLLHTVNGGASWTPVPAPKDLTVDQVRFGDPNNGWMWDADGGPDGVWSTHDGGLHWEQPTLPISLTDGYISDLEAADGVVSATVNADPVEIISSPISHDQWTLSPTTIPIGAGPVPNEQIILQGSTGWILEMDRVVIGGARLENGAWTSWTPPCSQAGGAVSLTAINTRQLIAYCDGGEWSGPAVTSLVTSSDGGSTFQSKTLSFPNSVGGPIASPSTGVVFLGDGQNDDLMATFNGGQTWFPVYAGTSDQGWQFVGFTTPNQGVAIDGGTMIMTHDGGRDWSPATFPSQPQ
jgi:hypothetical protein